MKKTLLLICLGFSGLSQAQAPVAHYPFNGNADDESGNGYDGTVAGATLTTDRFGNPNSAYEFNGGTTDSISCGNIPELNNIGAYSVACWLYQDVNPATGGIWNYGVAGDANYLQNRSYFDGKIYGYQNGYLGIDYSNINSGEWFHLTFVFDTLSTNPSPITFYINGQLINSGIATGGGAQGIVTTGASHIFSIGSDYAGTNELHWDGKIDDFYIYDVALSTSQIDSLYHLPNPNASLVAHYPFNGNANDESASVNVHNGTVTGATLVNDRFGNPNSAYNYNGTSDFIEVAHHSDISLDQQHAISFSAWINQNDVSNDGELNSVINKWENANNQQYGFWTIDNMSAMAGRSINASGLFDTISYNNNEWYHVVSIFDRANFKMKTYVNGVLKTDFSSGATNYSYTSSNCSLLFGAQTGASRFFDGMIDDIYIYNYALSPTEVDSLYNLPDPTSIGISKNTSEQISVYPNPTQDQLSFNIEGQNAEFKITSLSGQVVLNGVSNHFIDVSALSKGMYMLQLSVNKQLFHSRFIKE